MIFLFHLCFLVKFMCFLRCTIHFNVNNQMTNTVTSMNQYILSLSDDKQLVPGLISLIEQGIDVLRVKALLFVALLCKNSQRWLPHFFCNAKLISAVDRLGRRRRVLFIIVQKHLCSWLLPWSLVFLTLSPAIYSRLWLANAMDLLLL